MNPNNKSAKRSRLAIVALAMLSILLMARGLEMRGQPWLLDFPIWELQQTRQLKILIVNLGIAGLSQFGSYVVVGFVFAQCIAGGLDKTSSSVRLLLWALVYSSVLSAAVSMLASGPGLRVPNLLDMTLPMLGGALGGWIGASWAAGGRARLWIGVRLGILAGVVAVLALGLIGLMLASEPMAFKPAEIVSSDRVRLTKLIRSKSPRHIPDGETVTLSLTEKDINVLLAWGLSLGSSDRKALLTLTEQRATAWLSVRLPFGPRSMQYVNVSAAGWGQVSNGSVNIELYQLEVGRVVVPPPLLWLLAPALGDKIQFEPLAVPMLAQIENTQIAEGFVSGTYRRIDMPEGFRNDIFGAVGPQEQVEQALAQQFEQIGALSQTEIDKSNRFGTYLQAAFQLAAERSQTLDPVVENRAAIIALGIVFGHSVIGEFVGTIPHDTIPRLKRSYRLSLRDRVDWSRHFLVSAALEVTSAEAVSLDVGILKEELDAGTQGGSGFSFADLAADRSGTVFAKVATLDAAAARALQRRLRYGFNVDDYFPPAHAYPENLRQEELEAAYGGVNGVMYKQILREIDSRIAACAAYADWL